MITRPLCLAIATMSALTACAHSGGDVGNPLYRKLHWFSFVGGDDIAAVCAVAAPDRYRLVYNADWSSQVRIYEWGGDEAGVRIRVIGSGTLTALTLDDPLAPWRAVETRVPLSSDQRARLDQALAADGGFGPPAVGLDLPSEGYYWAGAICHGGHFTFTGWRWPSPPFTQARFPGLLFALDPGRAEVRAPRAESFDPARIEDRARGTAGDFRLTVGTDGPVR